MHRTRQIIPIVFVLILTSLTTTMGAMAKSVGDTDCRQSVAQSCYIEQANSYVATHPRAEQKPTDERSGGLLTLAISNRGRALTIMLTIAGLVWLFVWKPAPDQTDTSRTKR